MIELSSSLELKQPSLTRNPYPAARLKAGILCVGFIVCYAFSLLQLSGNQAAFSSLPLPGLFLGYVFAHVVLHIPFDLWAGIYLPRKHCSQAHRVTLFPNQWLRSVVISSLIFLGSLCLIHYGLVHLGALATLILVATFQGLLIHQQRFLAELGTKTSFIRDHEESASSHPVLHADRTSDGFSGGVFGLPGREEIVIPKQWKTRLREDQYEVALRRRIEAISSGLRTKGLLIALAWNVSGMGLGIWALGPDPWTGAKTLALSGLSTLWTFVGILILPTFSRWACLTLDAELHKLGYRPETIDSFFKSIEPSLDGEESRSPMVESIFHTIPSTSIRKSHAIHPSHLRGAWNVNRMMLYLSVASGSLLFRSVHCNLGRPACWFALPVD